MSSRLVSLLSLAFLISVAVFVYGYAVGKREVWPYALIAQTRDAVKSYLEFGSVQPVDRLMHPAPDAPRQRFVVHRPDMQAKGLYVFLGWDDEGQHYAAWLYDDAGKELFAWVLDYERLDPDGPSDGSDMPHPFAVLPDGSLIVGFDSGDVMARLDSCAEPLWTKPGIYHHAVTRADDGSFWTWRGDGSAYGHYNYLENFDGETGTQIRQIGLIEDVIQKLGASSYIFGFRPDFEFKRFTSRPKGSEDLFHANDVDVLHADIAPKFPDFEAGDLLLSFSRPSLVVVLDPDTALPKWWSYGPWRHQHDPDFTSDGTISVYDNNALGRRSEIVRMEPRTRRTTNELFHGNFRFFSTAMGTHQYLPNGNLLVVVPGEGRIVEVSGQGEKVMEFNNIARSEKHNAHVENAQWVPLDYFDKMPSCTRLASE